MSNEIKNRVRVILFNNDELLLFYDKEENYYFFPGGKIEFGETIVECANREISEEIGKDVGFEWKNLSYLREYIDKTDNIHSIEYFVFGEIKEWDELRDKFDPEFPNRKQIKMININELPDNLYPKELSKIIVEDIKNKNFVGTKYVGLVG